MGDPGDEDETTPNVPRTFTPTRPGLTDLDLLPAHFRLLAAEVKQLADAIHKKVVPALDKIVDRLDEDSRDIVTLKSETASLRDRVDDAQVQLLALAGVG